MDATIFAKRNTNYGDPGSTLSAGSSEKRSGDANQKGSYTKQAPSRPLFSREEH
jgi:hypothetical protein